MKALEEMYPQGEKVIRILVYILVGYVCECFLFIDVFLLLFIQAETAWALTVLGYLGKLILGVLG